MANFIVDLIRKIFVLFFRLVLSVYFKEIQVIGLNNVPKEGPIIFVGNHANQYVDPMCIVAYSPHHINFMVAASTYRQKIMGFLWKLFGAIPVERPQDIAQEGKGKIELLPGGVVKGHDTSFTKQAFAGDTLRAKGWPEYIISEVNSDTEMVVKAKDSDGCELNKLTDYKIAPKVDQSHVFAAVWDGLKNGKWLGIFPEGGSHDQTDLLPLKVGVAICGLGAMSKYKDLKVSVVCWGLKYFHPNRFRSKVIIEFSTPFNVDEELAKEYTVDKRTAWSSFLGTVEKKLRSVTFSAPSFKELRAVYLARRLYLPTSKEQDYSEEELNELYKRFFKGYNQIKDEPDIKKLFDEVYDYGRGLKSLGIHDSQIFEVNFKTFDLIKKILISIFRLLVSLVFVLPGIITLLPLGYLNRYLAEKERERALKKSTVKIVGADVMASKKILTTFILYPLTCMFFLTMFFILQLKYTDLKIDDIKSNWKWFFIFYPIYNYICVRSIDGVVGNFINLKTRVYWLFSRDRMEKLRGKRTVLAHKVHETIKFSLKKYIIN